MKFAFLALFAALLTGGCSSEGGTPTAPANSVAAAPAPAGQDWTQTVSKTEQGYVMGNPDARVKLVEYGARLCPACRGFAETGYRPLVDGYVKTGKVSLEFRDFLIHGPAELALAALGRCGGPAPFFPILEQTYADQESFVAKWQGMSPAQLQALEGKSPGRIATGYAEAIGAIDYMKQRGISDAKARQCLADEKGLDQIVQVTQKAGSDGTVAGTPTFILNGEKVDGIAWTDIEGALKRAGA